MYRERDSTIYANNDPNKKSFLSCRTQAVSLKINYLCPAISKPNFFPCYVTRVECVVLCSVLGHVHVAHSFRNVLNTTDRKYCEYLNESAEYLARFYLYALWSLALSPTTIKWITEHLYQILQKLNCIFKEHFIIKYLHFLKQIFT